MPTTVSCASCNRAHVFLLTTTLFDIALWLVIRKQTDFWGVRGAEEYCYRLDFAPALLSVRREGAIGWKPDIIPLSNLLRCYAKFA